MATSYRKKPVIIQAMQFTRDTADAVFAWVNQEGATLGWWEDRRHVTLTIPTLEGDMTASEGDYVIRGVQGEFYPCKPDIFEAAYELA